MSSVKSWYMRTRLFLNVFNFLNLKSSAAICNRSATAPLEVPVLHMCCSPDITTTLPDVFSLGCRMFLSKIYVWSSSVSRCAVVVFVEDLQGRGDTLALQNIELIRHSRGLPESFILRYRYFRTSGFKRRSAYLLTPSPITSAREEVKEIAITINERKLLGKRKEKTQKSRELLRHSLRITNCCLPRRSVWIHLNATRHNSHCNIKQHPTIVPHAPHR